MATHKITRRKTGKKKTRHSKAVKPKVGRLNLVIDPRLKRWAHEYAKRNHTTLTALITAYFVQLKELENKIDVEQI
jgi:hypothetical protein